VNCQRGAGGCAERAAPVHPGVSSSITFVADSGGRLRGSLTVRSQWRPRRRRCGRRCKCCWFLLLLFQKRQKRLEADLTCRISENGSLVLDSHNMSRLSKVPQSLSHARAGLGAAPIRVNRIVANGHSSRAPGEAIVVCAVESIRGRYLSVFLPVRGCVSPSARCPLILFDLVASYKSSRRSPSGAVAAFAETTAGGTCAETARSCRAATARNRRAAETVRSLPAETARSCRAEPVRSRRAE
jgi:hypothetical protein